MNQVVLLHDIARPYTSLRTKEEIATMVQTLLPHNRCSPGLAPADFHIFGPLKDALRGRCFADDDKLKYSVG